MYTLIKITEYPHIANIFVLITETSVIYNVLGLLASNNLQGAIDFLHRFLKELIQYGINHDDAITGYSYHNLGVLYFLAKRADVAQQYFIDALNIQMRHIQEPDIQTLVSVQVLSQSSLDVYLRFILIIIPRMNSLY